MFIAPHDRMSSSVGATCSLQAFTFRSCGPRSRTQHCDYKHCAPTARLEFGRLQAKARCLCATMQPGRLFCYNLMQRWTSVGNRFVTEIDIQEGRVIFLNIWIIVNALRRRVFVLEQPGTDPCLLLSICVCISCTIYHFEASH